MNFAEFATKMADAQTDYQEDMLIASRRYRERVATVQRDFFGPDVLDIEVSNTSPDESEDDDGGMVQNDWEPLR